MRTRVSALRKDVPEIVEEHIEKANVSKDWR